MEVMEANAQTCTVEELQEQVKQLKNELSVAKGALKYAEEEAKRYREWWLNSNSKVDDIKNDVEIVSKLITKFSKTW